MKGGVRAFSGPRENRNVASQVKREKGKKQHRK
jgi:hypothetical protein